jgi:hypothetical protein
MTHRVIGSVIGLTLLLAGCAGLAGRSRMGDHPKPVDPKPLVVDQSRSGSTVNIAPGQRLIVHLGESFRPMEGQKPSVQYPTELMSFSAANVAAGAYVFDARRGGVAKVWILAPGCHPGPMAGPGAGVAGGCPMVRPVQGHSTLAGHPAWLFLLTVHITPQ